jgi:hypothetical protein
MEGGWRVKVLSFRLWVAGDGGGEDLDKFLEFGFVGVIEPVKLGAIDV